MSRATITTVRRTLLTIAIVAIVLAAFGAPAEAREVSGVGATNFQTRVTSVTPNVRGIRVSAVELGSRLELTNETGEDIVVLGYQDEPYLRVGPHGVFENVRSPAVYINSNRQGTTPVPGSANPRARPDWHRISTGHVARWHDHRTHWMATQEPPAVQRAPDRTHVVYPSWTVTMRMGGDVIRVRGDLRWVPGPTPLPWFALVSLVFVAVVAFGLAWRPPSGLAVVLATLLVIDVVHAIGIGWTKAGTTSDRLSQVVSSSPFSPVVWAVTIAALFLLGRTRRAGLVVAAIAGALVALCGGVMDLTDLSRSQIPFAWSADASRTFVAVSVGAGFGVTVVAFVCWYRVRPSAARARRSVVVPT
jgi:hypothetical protein